MNNYNPFSEKQIPIFYQATSINTLLDYAGFELADNVLVEKFVNTPSKEHPFSIRKLNFNPLCFGQNIQRNYEYTLEDQQLLIDSIYNHRNIGYFLWNRITLKLSKHYKYILEHPFTMEFFENELLDGKQRLLTIIKFISNEFPDFNGKYYKDLSDEAQRKFFNFKGLAIGEVNEVSDEDKKWLFLNVNIRGKEISKEHLDFVKNLK